MSRCWGCLVSVQKHYLDGPEFEKANISMDNVLDYHCSGSPFDEPKEKFTVLNDATNVFKQGGIGRIGPFLNDYCRSYLGKFVLNKCLDSVVKIQTDGFVTTERVKYNQKVGFYHLLKFDMKYYGKFYINGINSFEKVL